jgi:cytochrome c-type biogenesis protein CcsB
MKKFFQTIISMPSLVVLLAIYAIAMAFATFIENDFGSVVSRQFVYNAWWFELVQLLLAINFIGNIFKYKLYKKSKWSVLLFHVAFIIILLGAAVTRYTGFEGNMNIREGETQNRFMSEKTYMNVSHAGLKDSVILKDELFLAPQLNNKYKSSFKYNGNKYELELKEFIPNAVKSLKEDEKGYPVMELLVSTGFGMQSYFLTNKSSLKIGKQLFYLNTGSEADSGIVFNIEKNKLAVSAPFELTKLRMKDSVDTILSSGSQHLIKAFLSYGHGDLKFSVISYFEKGKIAYISGKDAKENNPTILSCVIKSDKDEKDIYVPYVTGQIGESVMVNIDNNKFLVSYGAEQLELPFAIKLKDFQLERYPGSQSPSSYASEVTLIDSSKQVNKDFRIFMNNVLDYGGYRFFQSAYDPDEKGTILSVSHDRPGTYISYLGYFLMALGMFWALFNKNSHFAELWKKSAALSLKRKGMGSALMILIFLAGFNAKAQDSTFLKIDKTNADKFGQILLQDNEGRIKPLNTLNSELLRKISKKESLNGYNHNQVILGMMFNPEYWQSQPLIKVTNPELMKIIGTDQKLVPFNQFVDPKTQQYKLKEYLDKAFESKPQDRDKFLKDVIAVDERVNLAYQIFTGEFLKVFPIPGEINQSWLTPGEANKITQIEEGKFAKKVFLNYYYTIVEAQKSGNWEPSNQTVDSIINYQKKYAKEIIPSDLKIKLETQYVNFDIFNRIFKLYGLIGFIFLIILFVGILNPKINLNRINLIISILLGVIFLFHIYGLGIRWYISGHAPWSNGYESMIYISWATMLAGFLFVRRSPIVLAATALLAAITLMVAHLSWMDPQITNIAPVLKSYWLTIHVSVITASYGFLALGAILGLLNLIMMIMKTQKNKQLLDLSIEELTLINHMTLIIGIYLLSIGTFLGAVWANESWGKYWGWDPKETWALISIIVYTFVLHSRLIPGLNNKYAFNLFALLGFSSVLMTYFGVNYYLSGMHSYAQGDPVPIPIWVFFAIGIVILIALVAYFRNRILERKKVEKT